jgi:hypothetical protein
MRMNLSPRVLQEIIGTILISQTRVVPERAFLYGESLVAPLLEWLSGNNWSPRQISRAWNDYLRSNANRVAGWLQEHQAPAPLLVLLARSIPADALAVASVDLARWRPLLEQIADLEDHDAVHISAFLLALGLRHCDGVAMEFIEESFERVHAALAESRLDYEYWRPLEDVAPPLALWRSWDKCERMRAALVDRFITCDWQSASLLKAIRSVTTLEQVFALSSTTKPRKAFLNRTAKDALKSTLAPEYRRFLESYRPH